VFVALQPNFSNMFLIFLIGMIMLFVGNANLLHLMAVGLAGIVSAGIFAVSADYRLARLLSYFGIGEAAPNVAGYQLNQALIALGNGGLYGLGAGQSKQSYGFLPESYGDFIFSVIGEEYGFIGLLIIFIAFGIIFYRGMRIAKNAPDLFGYFLSIGIIIVIALYLFTHTAVNIGLFPTTGVPLPFISYGGTAVIVYSAAIGILLNISSQTNIFSINPKNKNKGEQNNER
jgi:cell division protein FtsW